MSGRFVGRRQRQRKQAGALGTGADLRLAMVQALQVHPFRQGLAHAIGLGWLSVDGDQGTAPA